MNLNRIKISLLLSVCLLMASCGFLDKDLDDTVTDEQILRDPTLMGGLLINIYNYIHEMTIRLIVLTGPCLIVLRMMGLIHLLLQIFII